MFLSNKIKQNTKLLHDKLEKNDKLIQLIQTKHLSEQSYADILIRFFYVIKSMEDRLVLSSANDNLYQLKQALILKDLQILGANTEEVDINSSHVLLDSNLSPWAVLYILNGSNHGAKVISAHLVKHQQHLPTTYFSSSRNYSRKAWLAFTELLDSQELAVHNKVIQDVSNIYKYYLKVFEQNECYA